MSELRSVKSLKSQVGLCQIYISSSMQQHGILMTIPFFNPGPVPKNKNQKNTSGSKTKNGSVKDFFSFKGRRSGANRDSDEDSVEEQEESEEEVEQRNNNNVSSGPERSAQPQKEEEEEEEDNLWNFD